MISLNEEDAGILTALEKFTGLSPAQTIQKLFPAHLEELTTYLTWLETLDLKDGSFKSTMGPHLLRSYGPESLSAGIKKLDPGYVSDAEKFAKDLADPTK